MSRTSAGPSEGGRSSGTPMRQPRVLQVVDSLSLAGAQRVVLDVTRLLTERKVAVTVLSLVDAGEGSLRPQVERAGARVVAIAASSGRGLLDVGRFARVVSFVRRGQFDLVQTHLCYANTIGCVAARLAGVPAVGTLHSTRPQHDGLKERLEGVALRSSASAVVAVGRSVADAQRGRVRDEVVVLPNGVESAPSITSDERQALRAEICGDHGGPVLLSAGRLAPEKGHKDVVAALELVRRHHPDVMLAVAGSGDEQEELAELISALGLKSSVRLLGWREDLPQLLMAVDAFVSGSYWEGLPIAVLQAMAAGLPVVATSVGEVPLLLGQDRGWLVHAGDVPAIAGAIIAMLDDLPGALLRGEAARRHVAAHYGYDQWGRSLIGLYQSLATTVAWGASPGAQSLPPKPCAG